MKHLTAILLLLLGTAGALVAAEAKQLRIPLGSLVVEEVPFKIDNVSVSNQSLVKVEIISENGRQVRISGLKTGTHPAHLQRLGLRHNA